MKKVFFVLFSIFLFCASDYSQEAQKIDDFRNIYCDEYLARMDSAINQAYSNPATTIYIFVYEGKEQKLNSNGKLELMRPTFGLAKAKIRSIKKYISIVRKFPTNRFVFVNAGFRENFTVEIWSVPVGAILPKPTPTLTKMKYRKGKATGFCIGF